MDFSFLPSWVGILGGTVAGVIAISFAGIQAWSAGYSATEKQKDQAAKDLVTILQATVETLKSEMKELQVSNLDNIKEISQLRGENQTLVKILQGRDETYMKFQTEGFAAFKRTEETNVMIADLLKVLRDHLVPKAI